jgi:peptidoglycan hydrolase-like protein with peptidoglycan-binding domain/cell wall-associated NlpC family hydrolase
MSDEKIRRLVSTEGRNRTFEMDDGSVILRSNGTAAWRNNNPGNLKFEYANSADQTVNNPRSKEDALKAAQKGYAGVVALDQWGNAIFESVEAGRAAQIKLLEKRHSDKTIPEMLKSYTRPDYSGQVNYEAQSKTIYAEGDRQGVNLRGKKIGDMTEKEIAAMADGIAKHEGWKVGETKVVSGPTRDKSEQNPQQKSEQSTPPTTPQNKAAGLPSHAILNEANEHFFKSGRSYEYGRPDHPKAGRDSSRLERDNDGDGKLGVDCSAFVWRSLKNAGYDVPGKDASGFTTQSLFNGRITTPFAEKNFDVISPEDARKPKGNLQPGDLLMFRANDKSGNQHIGIFKGYDKDGHIQYVGSQGSTGPATVTIKPGGYWDGNDKNEQTIVGALRAKPEFQTRAPLHGNPEGIAPNAPANPSGQTPAPGTPANRTDPAPQQPPTTAGRAVTLNAAYDMGIKYDHVGYGFGHKNLAKGTIDCAGWVKEIQNATMAEINKESGKQVFSDKDRFGVTTSDQMIESTVKKSGVMLTNPITKGMLKEGMIIGEDNGKHSWDKGRFHGIDHITMVVKNPKTGELMISQSHGGKNDGVDMMPLDKYLKSKQDNGVQLIATDPLAKARDLIDGKAQSQPNAGKTEAATPGKPEISAPNGPAARSGALSDGMLKFGEKGPEVERAQVLLNRLGYVGADGKPLVVDKEIGPNTLSAVQKFQNDHGIKDSGIIGPKTLAAMAAEDKKLMTHPDNPDNLKYKEVLAKVHVAEAGRGIASGPHSEKLAAALTVEVIREGITKVDRVELNATGTSARVVQVNPMNDLPPMNRSTDSINVAQAMKQPVRESSEQAVQVANNVQVQLQDQKTQTTPSVGAR